MKNLTFLLSICFATLVPAFSHAEFRVLPRVQYSFINGNGFSPTSDRLVSFEQLDLVSYGLSVEIGADKFTNSLDGDFVATLMYGNTQGDYAEVDASTNQVFFGRQDFTRWEGELLYRTGFENDSPGTYYDIGVKFLRRDIDADRLQGSALNSARNRDFEQTVSVALLRAGVGYTGAIGDQDRYRFFGYGSGGLGVRRAKDVFFSNPGSAQAQRIEDKQLGFAYGFEFFAGVSAELIYDTLDVAFRYRASIAPEIGGASDNDRFDTNFLSVVHGPELTMRLRW